MEDGFYNISIEGIGITGENAQRYIDDESITRLAETIKKQGILQPIMIRQIGSEEIFEVVVGARRLLAARKLGLETVPAMIISGKSDLDVEEMKLIENICREDLNPIDRALAILAYKKANPKKRARELAKGLGMHETHFSRAVKLATMPKKLHKYFREPHTATDEDKGFYLTQSHGEELFPLLDAKHEQLAEIVEWAYEKHMTVDKLRAFVKNFLKIEPETDIFADIERMEMERACEEAQSRLSRYLGDAKVKVKSKKTGGGKIEIGFKEADELQKLLGNMIHRDESEYLSENEDFEQTEAPDEDDEKDKWVYPEGMTDLEWDAEVQREIDEIVDMEI